MLANLLHFDLIRFLLLVAGLIASPVLVLKRADISAIGITLLESRMNTRGRRDGKKREEESI